MTFRSMLLIGASLGALSAYADRFSLSELVSDAYASGRANSKQYPSFNGSGTVSLGSTYWAYNISPTNRHCGDGTRKEFLFEATQHRTGYGGHDEVDQVEFVIAAENKKEAEEMMVRDISDGQSWTAAGILKCPGTPEPSPYEPPGPAPYDN